MAEFSENLKEHRAVIRSLVEDRKALRAKVKGIVNDMKDKHRDTLNEHKSNIVGLKEHLKNQITKMNKDFKNQKDHLAATLTEQYNRMNSERAKLDAIKKQYKDDFDSWKK